MLATVYHAADTREVADLEMFDVCTDCRYPANDFVARNRRIECVVPLIACGMQVRVTNAAVENVDLNVFGTG